MSLSFQYSVRVAIALQIADIEPLLIEFDRRHRFSAAQVIDKVARCIDRTVGTQKVFQHLPRARPQKIKWRAEPTG